MEISYRLDIKKLIALCFRNVGPRTFHQVRGLVYFFRKLRNRAIKATTRPTAETVMAGL